MISFTVNYDTSQARTLTNQKNTFPHYDETQPLSFTEPSLRQSIVCDFVPSATTMVHARNSINHDDQISSGLLQRMGGRRNVAQIIRQLSAAVADDHKLCTISDGLTRVNVLTALQQFFSILAVADDDPTLISLRMQRLEYWACQLAIRGYETRHFYQATDYLVSTLDDANVPYEVINEIVGFIAPLRCIFDHAPRSTQSDWQHCLLEI